MTKNILLAATALSAVVLAGAAQAQVITNVQVSGQNRAQNAVAAFVDPANGTSPFTAGVVTAASTTVGAGLNNTKYLYASETQSTTLNRTTTVGTTVSGRYLTTGVAGANVLGLLGNNSYQITITLTGAKFTNSVPASAFAFLQGDGTTASTAISAATIVSGGSAGDTSVTVQFAVANAVTGRTLALSVGGFDATVPFTLDTVGGTVGIAATTALAVGTGYTAPATLTEVIGTTLQRNRAAVVEAVAGYEFVAGGVTAAAANANAFAPTFADFADQLLLGATAPAFRTFNGANDGIGIVNFRQAALPGTAGLAHVGVTGNTIPAVTYDVRVDALTGTFGTVANTLRPGPTAGAVGTYTVATGGASASLAAVAGGTATTVNIGTGIAGTPTASLAIADQRYNITVQPKTASAGLVTLPADRAFTGQQLVLQGTSFLAPWMNSTVTGYNTVLRVANSATRNIGPVELTLTTPDVVTGTSATTCTSTAQPILANIPLGDDLVINSALLTACFGEFRRGDVTVRILDTVPTGSLNAKLRVVSPGGVISEQSLNNSSGLNNAAF